MKSAPAASQGDIAELRAVSRRMLDLAKAGQWDELVVAERVRLDYFKQVFGNGIDGMEELAREIVALDAEIMALVKGRMTQLQDEFVNMRTANVVQKVYQSVQDLG